MNKGFEAGSSTGMDLHCDKVMIRASIPLILLVLILGIPAISMGSVYTGQVLFAVLLVLFLGTLADAFLNRAQDDH